MSRETEIRKELGFEENIVYHYCGLEALFGIVSTKSLWLTCLESTNDKKELSYGKKLLDATLQEMLQNEKDEYYKNLLKTISLSPGAKEFKRFRPNYKYYGASFVKSKDSLTHWDRYGNSGQGVCIAINVWMIKNYLNCMGLPDIVTSWIRFDKILYNERIQKENLTNQILSMIKGFIDNSDNVDISKVPNLCSAIYYSALSQVKPLYKHVGFSDENEYRLILEDGQSEKMFKYFCRLASTENNRELFSNISKHIKEAAEQLNLCIKNKDYCVIGETIRSYYSMHLDEMWGDALIPEIVIGPKCYQNEKELLSFLKSNGLTNTKVVISEIPIR